MAGPVINPASGLISKDGGGAHGPTPPAEIVVSDLRKDFSGREVIKGISLTIRRGDLVAVVGSSGCGKTVFLDHITGLMKPTSGSIRVVDHSQKDQPLVDIVAADGDRMDEIRLHWAIVFQHNALFSGSVSDNVSLWLREHTELTETKIRKRVREALASVMLDADDVLSKDRSELSGGMAKRVAIARAIAIDPDVIFYDEPTTGLDPVVSGHIHELIWKTHHRPTSDGHVRTTILITHDRDLLRRISPRVIMFDAGHVVFDGPYERFKFADVPAAKKYLSEMPVLHARDSD
jgi:phospholipid/cholesterol/gamma-HCH transport system ATP-binding protein